jgi:hypothetical protein
MSSRFLGRTEENHTNLRIIYLCIEIRSRNLPNMQHGRQPLFIRYNFLFSKRDTCFAPGVSSPAVIYSCQACRCQHVHTSHPEAWVTTVINDWKSINISPPPYNDHTHSSPELTFLLFCAGNISFLFPSAPNVVVRIYCIAILISWFISTVRVRKHCGCRPCNVHRQSSSCPVVHIGTLTLSAWIDWRAILSAETELESDDFSC